MRRSSLQAQLSLLLLISNVLQTNTTVTSTLLYSGTQDLVDLTVTQYPDLKEVSQWFLEGRKHHFELNREAVHYFLKNDPSRVATEQPVEAWLKLEQHDVKQLATRSDELGQAAQKTFSDRQSANHPKNYDLRSAFADLLSHPKQIDSALNKYNQSIAKIEKQKCE